jgi:hypothetical protein
MDAQSLKSYAWWYWVTGGALYGVLVRLAFGALPGMFIGPMSLAFLLVTPFAVGAIAVYGGRQGEQSITALIFRPWLAVLLMLLGCAVTLLEGSICIAMLTPLFLVCASLGGLAMGLVLKRARLKASALHAAILLPLIVPAGEAQLPLQERLLEVRQSVEVDAPASVVWQEIVDARGIRADELPPSLAHLIGVPKPVEGVNVMTPDGEVRYSKWERGVSFRGIVTGKKEHQWIEWRYAFDAHSFPQGSMDEHVAIGGRYFDLRDTAFRLDGLSGGRTRLEIVAHYRVTSSVNFYAVPASKILGYDFVSTLLGLYKLRSERAVNRSPANAYAL